MRTLLIEALVGLSPLVLAAVCGGLNLLADRLRGRKPEGHIVYPPNVYLGRNVVLEEMMGIEPGEPPLTKELPTPPDRE